MGEIKSPLGKTQFDSAHSSTQRVFTVDDATAGDQFDIPPNARPQEIPPEFKTIVEQADQQPLPTTVEEALEARRRFAQQAEKIAGSVSVDAKRRSEMLAGFGRAYRNVEIVDDNGNEHIFVLRTLRGYEQNDLAAVTETAKRITLSNGVASIAPTGVYQIRLTALKHSLCRIDGIDIDIVLGTINLPLIDRLNASERFIDALDDAVATRLFNEYQDMLEKNFSKFAVQSPKDAKEAAEAIRKSGT